jgi:hypothetical protein
MWEKFEDFLKSEVRVRKKTTKTIKEKQRMSKK